MPSKSESQKRLFCMAYAVRKGKLKRSEVHKSVLDIVDGDMTDQQIKDFMVKECGGSLAEYVREALYYTEYANGMIYTPDEQKGILVIVKPKFEEYEQKILEMVCEAGFKMVNIKTKTLSIDEAKQLYAVHKDKEFFEPLCEYMSSGPSTAMIFVPVNPVWKEKKAINTIAKIKDWVRNEWGESERMNVMHSSDSYASAREESKAYFF